VLSSNVVFEPFSFLTLTNIQTGGPHQVRVRNEAPAMGVSGNFSLTVLADTDSDGLPDTWEAAYGFATNNPTDANSDPDADSFDNLAEYQAGTDPTNAASHLKIDLIRLPQGTNAVLVDFAAVSNRTYSLLCRPVLHTGEWNAVADIIARSSDRIVTVTNPVPPSATTRFYRLVTPRMP